MADRRPKQWFDADVALPTLTNAVAQFDQLSVPGDELRTLTVTRIIMDLQLAPASLIASPQRGNLKVTVGVGLATTDAIAAGVGSLPNIFSNVSFPIRGWLYKGAMFSSWENESGVVEVDEIQIMHLDLGAMRKLDNGVLFITAGSELISGTSYSLDLFGHCRFLCLT